MQGLLTMPEFEFIQRTAETIEGFFKSGADDSSSDKMVLFKGKNWVYLVHGCQVASVVSSSMQPCGLPGCQAPLSMGILQARILEWVAMSSSRASSLPRD